MSPEPSGGVKGTARALLTRAAPFAGVALVAVGIGYFLGYRAAPSKVTDKASTTVDASAQRKVESQVATRTEATQQKVERRAIKATSHTEKRPDGTVVTDRTVRTVEKQDTSTAAKADRKADSRASEAQTQHLSQERLTITDYRRNWRVSALVGAELHNPLSPVAFGLHVERRLLGPVWAGAWGIGVGSARTWYAGLSLGVEF